MLRFLSVGVPTCHKAYDPTEEAVDSCVRDCRSPNERSLLAYSRQQIPDRKVLRYSFVGLGRGGNALARCHELALIRIVATFLGFGSYLGHSCTVLAYFEIGVNC
ncbi:hypothetical protein MPY17_08935 [Rhodococcus opacus]|uniref:hypothetical protein n=1 Tax=Rhodococcus opacus TaxID=37919 RepID=UPI001FF334B1|nr:hypothetical protein [Rhodococcus opacus]UOT05843.1 hypothetical protein MPY17_08935 [Rhodococcus opacus]